MASGGIAFASLLWKSTIRTSRSEASRSRSRMSAVRSSVCCPGSMPASAEVGSAPPPPALSASVVDALVFGDGRRTASGTLSSVSA